MCVYFASIMNRLKIKTDNANLTADRFSSDEKLITTDSLTTIYDSISDSNMKSIMLDSMISK